MKSFVVEYRPRIKSGNAFIKFNNPLDKHSTKISLKPSGITVLVDGDEHNINTEEFFDINIKSFHSLMVKDNFLSFRFLTADDRQFSSEIIQPQQENSKTHQLKLNVNCENQSEVKVNVACSNCTSTLTIHEQIALKRVLELPSTNLNVSDWFCHRHENEKLFPEADGSNQIFHEESHTFQPKINDLFYAPFSVLLNSQHFDDSRLRRKKHLVYCKRCLQLLGECNYQSTTFKFWWESVKFQEKFIFDVTPIELLKNVITNHLACDVYIAPIVKMIFETKLPTEDKKLHILIQVMDKNLKLMQLNMDSMKLMTRKSFKIMYLKLTEGIPDDDQTLKFWQKDLHAMTFELSFKMFQLFLEYLESQSQLIPGVYRTSNNGFQLSYIDSLM